MTILQPTGSTECLQVIPNMAPSQMFLMYVFLVARSTHTTLENRHCATVLEYCLTDAFQIVI